MLFGAICVDESLLRRSREALKGKAVADSERAYRFVMDVALEYWEQYRSMPSLSVLRSNISAELIDVFDFEQDEIKECEEVLSVAKAINQMEARDRDKYIKASHTSMDRFIEEVYRLDFIERIAKGDLTTALSQSQQISVKRSHPVQDRFVNPLKALLLDRPAVVLRQWLATCGLLHRWYRPVTGDTVGHAAVRGAGKSTVADMLATDCSTNERLLAKRESRPPRQVYVFNYEKIQDSTTHIISHYAKVPRKTVEQFIYANDMSVFSRNGEFKDYELRMFAQMIKRAKAGNGPFRRRSTSGY